MSPSTLNRCCPTQTSFKFLISCGLLVIYKELARITFYLRFLCLFCLIMIYALIVFSCFHRHSQIFKFHFNWYMSNKLLVSIKYFYNLILVAYRFIHKIKFISKITKMSTDYFIQMAQKTNLKLNFKFDNLGPFYFQSLSK